MKKFGFGPKSDFMRHITDFFVFFFFYNGLNSTNPIFPDPTQATFEYGPRSDMCAMFCNTTSVWPVTSHFLTFTFLKCVRGRWDLAKSIFAYVNTACCTWRHVFLCALESFQEFNGGCILSIMRPTKKINVSQQRNKQKKKQIEHLDLQCDTNYSHFSKLKPNWWHLKCAQ